jgi:hypothetical protein
MMAIGTVIQAEPTEDIEKVIEEMQVPGGMRVELETKSEP